MTETSEDLGNLFIGGRWIEADGGERFDVHDPATGETIGTVADAGSGDVVAAIDAAEEAFAGWRRLPAIARGRILRRAAALLRERGDAIAPVMTAEQGKPLAESHGEVEYAASFLEWFAGEAERVYGQVVPSTAPDNRILVFRQPVGVTAAITPWNFPAAMLTRKLAPALAAGCTSVIKPAPATPLTAAHVLRALDDAGLPPGVANLVTSDRAAQVGEALFGDRRVRKVSFTGSTTTGRKLILLSATNITRLSLELGGHAPYIVFDDADLEQAVDGMIASKFRNAGQTCVCANRTFVQRAIHDDFVELLSERVRAMVVGRGTDPAVTIGPLIDAEGLEKVDRHVRDADARGGRIVVGGQRLTDDGRDRGHFFAPTVLTGTTADMLVAQEETFGPVAAIAAFDSEEEGIGRANDSPYGLAAYFHTRDYARLLRVAERLDYGIVGVNSGKISAANVPFGGVKASGFGREGGSYGIDEYIDVKYVLIGGVG